jgi:hypothetical protein
MTASRFSTYTCSSPPCAPAQKHCSGWCGSAGRTALQKPVGYENQWHWPRDTQLGEDAHRYAQRNGVQVLALLRTLALNLLRSNGFHSIRAGLMAVAHDQGLLEVCPCRPGWAAAPTVSCAGTAPVLWLPSPPLRLTLQAI